MSAYEYSVREKYHILTKLLIERNLTVTAMESATSGQIASLIIRMGVPEDIIRRYSVYSVQTAEAMATSCAAFYNADIGIGVTGTMGNVDPANADNSIPGCVYFAVYFRGTIISRAVKIEPQGSRLLYKLAAAEKIADTLLSIIC